MFAKLSLTFVVGALAFAMTPMTAVAQGSSPDAPRHESTAASQSAQDAGSASDSGSVLATLRLSYESAALLAPPTTDLSMGEETSPVGDPASTPLPAEGKGSGTGLGLMIGGAAALVGGLLIGGTAGDVIAIGGVAIGVWGIIVYF